MCRLQNSNWFTKKKEKILTKVLLKRSVVIENKNNFISVIGDKFASSIICEKFTTSFCKKFFKYINYLQLLM